ncbi:MAG: lipocalin-like domain-containing protein [Lysobacterales bacterium]
MSRRHPGVLLTTVIISAGIWLSGCSEPPASASLQQTLGGDPDPGFSRAVAVQPLRFPMDHGAHPDYQTEWWYFTGHVSSNDLPTQRNFGYQLTFFRQALTPQEPATEPLAKGDQTPSWAASQLFLAHFAISDLDRGTFYHAQRLTRGSAGQGEAAEGQMAVRVEDWQVTWEGSHIVLRAKDHQHGIGLKLNPLSAIIPQGDRGLSTKGAGVGNASYYYSIPELETRGTLEVGSETFSVQGDSWLDREWSTSVLEPGQAGWDWFSLNLQQGRYLMLFQLRDADGNPDQFSAGTLVDSDQVTKLNASDFTLAGDKPWRSPHSGALYPLRWQINLPGQELSLTVSALMQDQEINQTFRYWEGAVSAQGQWRGNAVQARGYLEMTGYDDKR